MSRQGLANGMRNTSNGSSVHGAGNIPQSQSARSFPASHDVSSRNNTNASRAERFEDEKRRIIESCFSKLDSGGQLAESYITHVRIIEDAQHPSTPAPPESPPENKKPRVIVIAVRSTGRVRMHKARENTNGSFSIGKTWNLEELSAIESFSHSSRPPTSEREAAQRQWAGSTGFTVTITKPYFWQAGTSKEKDFFIASAVKIYRKYTKGQIPELRGFDDAERDHILGQLPIGAQSPQAPPPISQSTQLNGRSASPAPPQPPFAQRDQSRDDSRYRGSPGPPPSLSDQPPPSMPLRQDSESPARFNGMTGPAGPRAFASQEQMRSWNPPQRGDSRPGTSPSPAQVNVRSPPPVPGAFPAPGTQTSRSQLRPESPAVSSNASIEMVHPSQRSAVPQNTFESQQSAAEPSGTAHVATRKQDANGPSLFHTTRQHWQQASQDLDFNTGPSIQRKTSQPDEPQPFKSEAQPASPQKNGGLADRSAREYTTRSTSDGATPVSPTLASHVVNDPGSPPTPERSRRRPFFESKANDDLRPEPLMAASRPSSSRSHGHGDFAPSEISSIDHSAEVRPLAIGQSRSVAKDNDLQPSQSRDEVAITSKPLQTGNEPDATAESATSFEEQFRPGLGPMIKKGTARDRFRKAATAASAFKPRPGGAAEKIMRAKAEREAGIIPEPDGITSVVPRPQALQPKPKADEVPVAVAPDESNVSVPSPQKTPEIDIYSPTSPTRAVASPVTSPVGVQLTDDGPTNLLNVPSQSSQVDTHPDTDREGDDDSMHDSVLLDHSTKVKVRSQFQNLCLDELGIDRSLLESKGLDFETMLEEFGWKDEALNPSKLSRLEHEIRREQGRLEAGSWLASGADLARDEKVSTIESLLDKTIAECEELDGLLTLYSVQLGTLNDDVMFIEAQSQGLQVQAANQQLLQSELQGLLQIMSLDRHAMDPLRFADLESVQSLQDVEQSLVMLYQAMVTIDPSLRSTDRGQQRRRSAFAGENGNELASMRAVRDKKEIYNQESSKFCQRIMQHLDYTFTTTFNDAKKHALRPASYSNNPTATIQRVNKDAFTDARRALWIYGPLLLFTKEVDRPAWNTLLRMYYSRAQPLYADTISQNTAGWKKLARKPMAEEAELLFTVMLKNETSAPGTGAAGMGLAAARKLTVKRSHTLAKSLRHASGGEKHTTAEPRPHGSTLMSSEVFAGALDEMTPMVLQEQNCIVDLFHATTLETTDFLDLVRTNPIEKRNGINLLELKPIEPDREMAKRVHGLMTELFESNFGAEMQRLMEWALSLDPLQGVGIMASLSRHAYVLQDTSQEYLAQTVESLLTKLQARWNKFVEEQVRAIEDTKVKIKKRKGVIGFMKVFPHFSAAVENIFSTVAALDYEGPSENVASVRRLVDDAYTRINRAMFDSLKVIAKESPTAGMPVIREPGKGTVVAGGEDPEDKEMLNFHILLIENMNHYVEGVDDGGKPGVLAEWRGRAMLERAEALEAYVSRVLKRPLGKLIDFLDSVESLQSTSASPNPQSIALRPSYSRKAARNLLAQFDAKETRRGIDTLRRRIEKHFGEADEEAYSRQLVGLVCKECERGYERAIDRVEAMIRDVYPPTDGEKPVDIEFSRADVSAGFRR